MNQNDPNQPLQPAEATLPSEPQPTKPVVQSIQPIQPLQPDQSIQPELNQPIETVQSFEAIQPIQPLSESFVQQPTQPLQPMQTPQPIQQFQTPLQTPAPYAYTAASASLGILTKLIIAVVFLGVIGGGGYYGYQNYVKTGKIKLPSGLNLSFIPEVNQLSTTKTPISQPTPGDTISQTELSGETTYLPQDASKILLNTTDLNGADLLDSGFEWRSIDPYSENSAYRVYADISPDRVRGTSYASQITRGVLRMTVDIAVRPNTEKAKNDIESKTLGKCKVESVPAPKIGDYAEASMSKSDPKSALNTVYLCVQVSNVSINLFIQGYPDKVNLDTAVKLMNIMITRVRNSTGASINPTNPVSIPLTSTITVGNPAVLVYPGATVVTDKKNMFADVIDYYYYEVVATPAQVSQFYLQNFKSSEWENTGEQQFDPSDNAWFGNFINKTTNRKVDIQVSPREDNDAGQKVTFFSIGIRKQR